MNFRGSNGVAERAPVSVVIPCYCCSETIGRALDSIATQTMLPNQVLLVEDASPDEGKTQEMLHYLGGKYGDVFEVTIVLLNKNVGAASARNRGWDAANQPYIAFLDADDTWHPRKIEIQYEFMAAHPQIAFSGHRHVPGDSDLPVEIDPVRHVHIKFWHLLLKNPCITPSVMLKRGVTERFLEGRRYMEDHLLWMLLGLNGGLVLIQARLAKIHKAPFGAAGLSSHLWRMERGDLDNYWLLRRCGHINLASAFLLSIFSLAKFLRRLLLVVLNGSRRALD